MTDLAAKTSTLHVDIDSFDGMLTYLDDVIAYVEYDLIKKRLQGRSGGVTGALTHPTMFGDTDDGATVYANVQESYSSVLSEAQSLLGVLHDLRTNTATIQKDYTSLEAKNAAGAKRIEAILAKTSAKDTSKPMTLSGTGQPYDPTGSGADPAGRTGDSSGTGAY